MHERYVSSELRSVAGGGADMAQPALQAGRVNKFGKFLQGTPHPPTVPEKVLVSAAGYRKVSQRNAIQSGGRAIHQGRETYGGEKQP